MGDYDPASADSLIRPGGVRLDDGESAMLTAPKKGFRRYLMVLLTSLGLVQVYAMRVNLSEAVIPMSQQFGWDKEVEGYVLSSFFIGYIFGQIPGGYLANRFGGCIVFGVGVLATALFTLVLPLCTTGNLRGRGDKANLPLLYALRVAMGLFESVTCKYQLLL